LGTALADISGLNISSNSLDIQLFQASGFSTFLMIGEVTFDGAPSAPEPSAWTLAAGGIGLVAV